ncbi:TonB-dependent receptor [Fodinibius salsisoli]|uniref:TonB-dependent receptor n=1 Tax=Fodinibius salsisoli TaxID=2820877 RepID=A0ABT3PL20_9BACT|nr:carboxypeptidase regulatory-like domain-containing protein [Fodinibius salsisoli]MCW9706418.1 TonB-dependent receptor [Fodinibius salsisoli]
MAKLLQAVIGAVLICLCTLLTVNTSYAQVTTASIEGQVTDESGEPLAGANIIVVHEPSGTQRGVSTRSNGRFTLPNLRIGGPYTVTATFIGFEKQVQGDITLSLGKTQTVNFQLAENVEGLDEVVVTAGGDEDINESRTGAATTIDNAEIQQLPTITRSAEDIYRLAPSSDGNSFAGRNDQFNNFSLDGSIFNNPFGLDAATPGGQSNAQPISLDAIDQIQVSVAPYDVTQAGFTGAAVNAVTKSGTNTFKGSVFGFYRNEDFTGSKVEGNDIFVPDLTQFQTGLSLGGPIIKDKLFFFANFELDLRDDLGSNFLANNSSRSGGNVSRVEEEDLMTVSNALADRYGYSTGAYERYSHDTDNNKGIFKLDWNINNNHSLTATYNFLDAFREQNAHPSAIGRRGPDQTTLQFHNSGYRINNKIQSGIVELRSLLGNKFSNKLQVGYTHFDDSRDPFSSPFPTVNISKNGIRYIVAGHEPFSIHNRLDQKVYQVTNNFDIFAGDHTITIGTSFEAFKFDNSFNLGAYYIGQPGGVFSGAGIPMENFVDLVNSGGLDAAVENAQQVFDNNNANDSWALAETNVGQWAIYAQDKWTINNDFTFTYGLRVDMPLYFNTKEKIRENIERKGGTLDEGGTYAPDLTYYDEDGNPVQFSSTELPEQTPILSPRIGFNWNPMGNQTLQLRGGSGLFTGRFPFVWVGNQVANTGFSFYQVTDPDFQFPQVWRSNIGVEKRFKGGWLLSSDFIFTKDVNGVLVKNFGLKPPSGTLNGVDNRAYYTTDDYAEDPNGNQVGAFGGPAQNAYVFTNTDKGRSFNWTVEVKKRFGENFFTSLAYNYLDAQDVNSIEAEISSDAFARNPALGNVNTPNLSPSLYGNKHRFVGTANKTFRYGQDSRWATTFSLFFEYAKGGRFSYTYSGDANGDGSGLNDLIYIPTESELQTYSFTGSGQEQEAQRQAFSEFIAQDDYLSSRRGQYAEKYAVLSPWYSQYDLRVLQKLNLGNNSIEFSIDVLNIGNLLNSEWGVRKDPTNSQPVGINVADPSEGPVYSFDPSLNNTYVNTFGLESRWRVQFGLRYSFN